MDRTGIIVVTLCSILLGVWFVYETKHPPQQILPPAATSQMATTQTVTGIPAMAAAAATAYTFNTNAPEELLVITNVNWPHERYTFTSRGGGLKLVELTNYPETVSLRWKKEMATNGVATLNTHAPVPVLAVLGDPKLVGDGNFTLTTITGGVRAEKLLPDGLRLVKEFRLGSNYLVNASVRLENGSDQPLALPAQEWVVGTATPMGPDDNGMTLGTMWGDGTNSAQDCLLSYFSTNTTALFVFPRTPKTEYRAGNGNVVWAAAHNQFFALIAMPKDPAASVVARAVPLPALVKESQFGLPTEGIQTALVYPAQTLTAGQSVEHQIVFFAGPKEYRLLAQIGEDFHNHADQVMQFGYLGFFAKALLVTMNWLHDVTKLGYGWVIVLITIMIKVLFWPLTAASTRSMKRMQALAPEVAALKEKYKDDLQKFTQKQMELWKKNKVSPVSGCLPMLVQMPIFIGFFTMIRSAIELRGAHFLWVADLSKSDTLFMIPGLNFIPFIGTPEGLPFNLLPLLMGGAMLWQSHLTPMSPGMDATQAKIMRYMPLMFLVFLYNYPAGLALYWTVNNLLTIVQTKLTAINTVAAAPAVSVSALTPTPKKKK
jgi:YidC/Oxa1 family membrane protein insertase